MTRRLETAEDGEAERQEPDFGALWLALLCLPLNFFYLSATYMSFYLTSVFCFVLSCCAMESEGGRFS